METTFLHITNGDSAAALIKQTGIGGDVLPWRDPMHHGPFHKTALLTKCSDVRANHLAGGMFKPDAVRREFAERDSMLDRHAEFTATVLWYEHDLLDQLQILQILSHLTTTRAVYLICIDHFPGIEEFRGLGQLTPSQLLTLFDSRSPVTTTQLTLAHTLWQQFCADDPEPLLIYAKESDTHFPFLGRALIRHFQEFPWTTDGLTRTERQILTLIDQGSSRPRRLFVDNMAFENALYIGDWHTYQIIDRLACSVEPLITTASGSYQTWKQALGTAETYQQQELTLTETGKAVLRHSLHAATCVDRDEWLGGIHLQSSSGRWQWDNDNRCVLRTTG